MNIKKEKQYLITEHEINQIRLYIPKKDHSTSTHKGYKWHILNILKKVQERPV